MAKITMKGLDQYSKKLAALGAGAEGVCKYAVYEGAAIVADAIRQNVPVDSGDLQKSMALTVMRNENGFIYTQIAFPGYDSKGTPNAVKAAVLESGSSTRQKHPFIRPAVNAVKARAEIAMAEALEYKINQIMEG